LLIAIHPLGKGFALMNAGEDSGLRDEGMRCMQEAMSLAEVAGEDQKVAFIKMLLERDGKLDGGEAGDGGCCKDDPDADDCDEHTEVANAVATGENGWTKEVH
jgi:hypothetical protein